MDATIVAVNYQVSNKRLAKKYIPVSIPLIIGIGC